MSQIIGRENEKAILKQTLQSTDSELIVVYGRRRVGKTFLIREYFKKNMVFEVVGLSDAKMKDQLQNFHKELTKRNTSNNAKIPVSWFEAFGMLEKYLDSQKSKTKKVVFIDEFPWIASPKSKFLTAFENFWNSYCTKRNDIIVVICGSAAAFMVQKIIKNKKGLHNRLTRKIRLLPFTIKETREYLRYKGIKYTPYDTAQLYMAIGGVPHYLDKLDKTLSVAQNLDVLCFSKDGLLRDEFNILYASLFSNSEKHLIIIKTLAESSKGLSRSQLIQKSGIPSGGDMSLKLDELIESGFITEQHFFHKKKQDSLYRLVDEYSKFYLKFIHSNRSGGEGTWLKLQSKQTFKSWAGFAFENICLKHVESIKQALRIDAIYSVNHSWHNDKAQIDLIIDRDDNVINIVEIKFYKGLYNIDKPTYHNLKHKLNEFQASTQTRKTLMLTLITSHGLKENEYSREVVNSSFTMDILFK